MSGSKKLTGQVTDWGLDAHGLGRLTDRPEEDELGELVIRK